MDIFLFISGIQSIREYNNILGKRKEMIKVFLVEDEKIIRKSIKNNVKWEENGFEFREKHQMVRWLFQ